jgi:hypothetical protein
LFLRLLHLGIAGWEYSFIENGWNVIEERGYNANGELTYHLRHTWGVIKN